MTIVNYLNTTVITSNIIAFIIYNLSKHVCKILSPLLLPLNFIFNYDSY